MKESKEDLAKIAMVMDAAEMSQRKASLELTDSDIAHLKELHVRLGSPIPAAVEDFYSHLLAFDATRDMLNDDVLLSRLHQAQAKYSSELTAGCYELDYALNRIQVGHVHERVKLEPKWYIAAYRKYLAGLLAHVWALYKSDADKALAVFQALLKVAFLDTGLVLEAYFSTQRRATSQIKEYAQQIASCMSSGFLVLDMDLNILSANNFFKNMFMGHDNKLEGTALAQYLPASNLEDRAHAVLETGDSEHNIFLKCEDKEGIRHFKATLSLAVLDDEKVFLMILEDMTGSVRLQSVLETSELYINSILENIADGILTINEAREIESCNPAAEGIFGYHASEVVGKPIALLVPDEPGFGQESTSPSGSGQRVVGIKTGRYELEGRRCDGAGFPLDVAISEMRVKGRTLYIMVARDITERKEIEEDMSKLSSAIEQTADSVIITDSNGVVTYVNGAFEKVTGYTKEEILGERPSFLKSGRHDKSFYERLWRTIKGGEAFSEIFINRNKGGKLYYEEKTIAPLKDKQGNINYFISTGKDITERMQAQEHFRYVATHDALTDLPNRTLLSERLNQALVHARRNQRIIALLCLDLDRFSAVNDTLGHHAGDELLQAVSQRLCPLVREGDLVARLSGNEFGILLDRIAIINDIPPLANKILHALAEPFDLDGHEVYVSASIGISCYPDDGADAGSLLKNASVAMYRAKEGGKNRYQFYASDMSSHALRRLSLESSLRHALEREEFVIHYQPQVNLVSGKIEALEALIRWQRPEVGLVSPLEFIPMLEETGLIVPVGEWLMHAGCLQSQAWAQQQGLTPRISLNFSARQFNDPNILEVIKALVRQTGVNPQLLEIEITESVLMQGAEQAILTMQAFKDLGIRIAVDDFGTGYSSLGYLKRFPIDTLKVDRSFVRDIPDNVDDTAITDAIITLAHTLGLEVVAEGVETEQQLEHLRSRGCDFMQGFLFSKPVPAAEIGQMLNVGKQLKFPKD